MWAVTHLCNILPVSCLFDYKLIGFICPQQAPFGTDRQLGQLLCWHCSQEVWKGTRVRGWLLHSQKGTNPEQPLQILLEKRHKLGLGVSPHSCCTKLVLLDLLSLIPSGGRCRPHILPVQEGSREEKLLY